MAYTARRERRRGFGYYWVWVYTCECGRVTVLRENWRGTPPPGGIRCECGNVMRIGRQEDGR